MVRTENVSLTRIQFSATFYSEWYGDEDKKQPCPYPIEYSRQFEVTWKEHRNEKEGNRIRKRVANTTTPYPVCNALRIFIAQM
jgi:hypothetical protein